MVKYNKESLDEQVEIDYQNFRTVNRTVVDSLSNTIKKIDKQLIEINDALFNICQTNKLTYKVGIYMKNPKKFIIWYGFNINTKKWKFATRSYKSITTTVRQNSVFNDTKDFIFEYLQFANELLILRKNLCIDNKLMSTLTYGKKKFEELLNERK